MTTTVRTSITSAQREQVAKPIHITPAIVSAVRWIHGDTAADTLIARAMAR